MNKKIKIFIIEDHKLMRTGLKSLFEGDNNILVTGEAESGRDGLERVLMQRPDVVILDLFLSDISGIAIAKEITEKLPDTKIIVLTSSENNDDIEKMLKLGINAYVLKDIEDENLLMIVKTVSKGAMWLDSKVVNVIKNNLGTTIPQRSYTRAGFRAKHSNLTQREYEVLKLIVDGKSNHQIADILSISEHTSKAHVCNIIQKLVVDDRTQAAIKAIKEGIV